MVGSVMMRLIAALLIGVLLVCTACTKPKPPAAEKGISQAETVVPTMQPSPAETIVSVWDTSTPVPIPTSEVPAVPLPTATPTPTPTTVPISLPATVPVPTPEEVLAPPEVPGTHVVQKGETLFSIGQQYGIPWQDIAQANGIDNPSQLFAGQKLTIPQEGEAPPVAPTEGRIHVVQQGENLFRIGLKYGVDWQDIARANGIESPTQIYVGQKLVIP